MKRNQIARGVRVKLNENFEEKCLGDKHLMEEPVLFIADASIYNDILGDYVYLHGGSGTTSGYAYLDQIDPEFPFPEGALYSYNSEGNGWADGAIEYFLGERKKIDEILRKLDNTLML